MIILILKYFFIALAIAYGIIFLRDVLKTEKCREQGSYLTSGIIGGSANFLDTLGIGSYATSTVLLRTFKQISDKHLPGVLNVMCPLPTLLQSVIFLQIIDVDGITLLSMVIGATLGGWLGANFVVKLSEQKIRVAMAVALSITALLMLLGKLHFLPEATHDAIGLTGIKLGFAVVMSVLIGSLGSIGIGFYAPCLALVYLLGMSAAAAFPIMMSCCATSSAMAGLKFIKSGAYNRKVAVSMVILGLIGVLFAAFVVKSLPLNILMWIVIGVVFYAAMVLFLTYLKYRKKQGCSDQLIDDSNPCNNLGV